MKQFSIRILVLLLFLAGTFMAQAQTGGYSFAQSTETFTVPTTGLVGSDGLPSTSPMPFLAVWDDGARTITLPFPIAVKNQIFTSVTVSPNGYINFGNNYLYGFVADLYPRVNSTFNATRSLGSNQLVSVSSMTGLKTGMRISGSGITDGTIITAISGSTVTMSSNATASGNFSVMSDSGIYCTVSGTAPNRIFTVVYRDVTFFSGTNDVMDFKIEVGTAIRNLARILRNFLPCLNTGDLISKWRSTNIANTLRKYDSVCQHAHCHRQPSRSDRL